MSKPYVRLDKNNAAVLLVDHQAGLLSLVRDIDPDKFRNNVMGLSTLFSVHIPNHQNLMNSYSTAKSGR